MISPDAILFIASEREFRDAALELFHFQAKKCEPYSRYIELTGVDTGKVDTLAKIPFLPVEIFKNQYVYCGKQKPEIIFTSSTTGGGLPSKHYVESHNWYLKVCRTAFEHFYGPVAEWSFYGLLPSYLEREGSSLITMGEEFISVGGGGVYLHNHKDMIERMASDPKKKMVIGVTYALLELAEELAPKLKNTVVVETGGMKGHSPEMLRSELHGELTEAFGIGYIASEYGMCEMMSQCYSKGSGIFESPPWVRILIRDMNDPFDISVTGRGGINIIDLANASSCAFIQTSDIGTLFPDNKFELTGRIKGSDIRGCNLMLA